VLLRMVSQWKAGKTLKHKKKYNDSARIWEQIPFLHTHDYT
jgi:hypothetical protein